MREHSTSKCGPLPWTPGSHMQCLLHISTQRSKAHTETQHMHGLNFWCTPGNPAFPISLHGNSVLQEGQAKKPCSHPCLLSFSHSPHLGCPEALCGSSFKMHSEYDHFSSSLLLQLYSEPSHFCSKPTGLTACTLAFQQPIVYIAPRVMFPRHKSEHVAPPPRTASGSSSQGNSQSTYNGLQGPEISASAPASQIWFTPTIVLVHSTLSTLASLPGMLPPKASTLTCFYFPGWLHG